MIISVNVDKVTNMRMKEHGFYFTQSSHRYMIIDIINRKRVPLEGTRARLNINNQLFAICAHHVKPEKQSNHDLQSNYLEHQGRLR